MKKRRFRWPALWRRRGRTVIEYLPDADEIERNPRSAPVRLRAVQRAAPGNPGRGGKN